VTAYFATGFFLLFTLQWIYAQRFGGDVSRLLHVEPTSELRPFIEKDLGAVVLGTRNDGQVNYAVARRPFGDPAVHDRFAPAGLRYRRWLYSLLAGGFGTFAPRTTLWGLILLASAGAGAATAALGLLAERYGLTPLVVLTVLGNPGVWVSCQILTGDTVALALALWGVVAWIEARAVAAWILFALMGLTKEVYLLVPAGLVLHELWGRRPRTAAFFALTPVPLVIWAASFAIRFPETGSFSAWGNLALPFAGLVTGMQYWPQNDGEGFALAVASLVGVLLCLGTALTARLPLLRFLSWPWVGLAIGVSDWIWARGPTAIRGFLPVFVLVGLHLAVRFRRTDPAPAPTT
jgi:hypothetical protein